MKGLQSVLVERSLDLAPARAVSRGRSWWGVKVKGKNEKTAIFRVETKDQGVR